MSADEMEELAAEMVGLAQNGVFAARNAKTKGPRGNLFDSDLFSDSAKQIRDTNLSRGPEYAIDTDLRLQSQVQTVRERIVRNFSHLHRNGNAKPNKIFSRRFLNEFDWINGTREKTVSHAVQHQSDFINDPSNPLLLKELTQKNIADVIGCHVTTVNRLMKELLIQFPDTVVRDFAILVPGNSITALKGRYVMGMLTRDPRYYERSTGWKMSEEKLAEVLQTQYGLPVQRRAVNNYARWIHDHLLTPRRAKTSAQPIETEEELDGGAT
ncbi:MAG TPA: hypothetical protein VI913_03085 [Candidatus Peribacteraceae bacterium]|nr:hypothetical protein [Candidatus Peribacteraceae bacterium]